MWDICGRFLIQNGRLFITHSLTKSSSCIINFWPIDHNFKFCLIVLIIFFILSFLNRKQIQYKQKLHDNTLSIQLKQHEYIGNFTQKYLTWKSFLYSFELELYSVLLVFTQNYSKLVFFGNSILDSLYTR